ncbi:MAG: hypothetical protein NTU51_05220 [Bacteroidetes bacterium]|nr:hypothetical protein [Bacteroidota bacterium]
MYLIRLVKAVLFVRRFFKTQRKFNTVFVDAFVEPFCRKYDRRLDSEVLHKIKNYYCIGVPVVCAGFARMYGRELTGAERENATLGGIITPLIDDFTDKQQVSPEQLNSLLSFSEQAVPSTLEEAIVNGILVLLYERVSSKEGTVDAFKRTLQAQQGSARQTQKELPQSELLKITMDKGAWSLILYHYLITEVPSEAVIRMIYQMGGVLQIAQDIFDVYRDFHEGVATLGNTCGDYREFEKFYLGECRKFCSMARALPFRHADLEFFIVFTANSMARGIVALRRLRKLQGKLGGGILPFDRIDRKDLICDMEKPLNFLRMNWYGYSILARRRV